MYIAGGGGFLVLCVVVLFWMVLGSANSTIPIREIK